MKTKSTYKRAQELLNAIRMSEMTIQKQPDVTVKVMLWIAKAAASLEAVEKVYLRACEGIDGYSAYKAERDSMIVASRQSGAGGSIAPNDYQTLVERHRSTVDACEAAFLEHTDVDIPDMPTAEIPSAGWIYPVVKLYMAIKAEGAHPDGESKAAS